ncbi:RNA polymerase sigma factor RpoD [uncultured archaeon]|nr:RNA polymerase sigma factor RpoD [uncultured archaeon]
MDEETYRLGRIIQDYNNGNSDYKSRHKKGFLKAKNQLVELRIDEIAPYYKKRYKRKIDKDTLKQLIYQGAVIASEDFNPDIADFQTHADYKIKKEISTYLQDGGERSIHLTDNGYTIWLPLIREAERVLSQKLAKKINDEEIVDYILQKNPERKVRAVYEAVTDVRRLVSHPRFHATYSPDNSCPNPLELLAQKEELKEKNSRLKKLNKILNNGVLDAREKKIIRERYGIDTEELTLKEIGEQSGITKERVRQIEAKAVEKIRNKMNPGRKEEDNKPSGDSKEIVLTDKEKIAARLYFGLGYNNIPPGNFKNYREIAEIMGHKSTSTPETLIKKALLKLDNIGVDLEQTDKLILLCQN